MLTAVHICDVVRSDKYELVKTHIFLILTTY